MSDLISRQAAIEAVESAKTARTPDGEIYVAKLNAEMNIRILPPAQPEDKCSECDAWNKYKNYRYPQWIPVTERLPEECKQVLVCDDYQFIYVAEYEVFSDGVGRWSESTELLIIENVTAWMPLPEPWRGQ